MIQINEEDANFLRRSLELGEVVLVLGAGASFTSKNARGEPVKQADALADRLATRAGMQRTDETLTDVLEAVYPRILSKVQRDEILADEYLRCTPADELSSVLDYVWKRVYTWNIDDTLENISGRRVQNRHHFNGMAEKVFLYNDITHLEVIHLHGQMSKPDSGFILTEKEYNDRLINDDHDWYKQLGRDYVAHTPVFIGSRLKEPILALELDRARGDANSGLGRAFLITPDELTPIQVGGLSNRNIAHLRGTLADFVEWLQGELGGEFTASQSASAANAFVDEITSRIDLADKDLDTLKSVFPIRWANILGILAEQDSLALAKAAEHFLTGSPPGWQIAASDIPVTLAATNDLYDALSQAINNRDRLFIVHGQAGSGKTTALLQCMLRFSRELPDLPIYEIKSDAKSLRSALRLLEKIHDGAHVLVYVSDVFLYGEALAEDAAFFTSGRFTIVSSARSGEWKEHLSRRLGDTASTFIYQRFGPSDYQPLIDRLVSYVPAPKFVRLAPNERIASLAKSNSQLLIALREATESKKFSKIITDEYNSIVNTDARILLTLVGVATLARVGLSKEIALEAYEELSDGSSFEEATRPLDGIVLDGPNGRLVARHELYVRHLIDNVVDLDRALDSIIAVLRTFTRYKMPITKTVGKQDAQLFRYLLGHNFLYELCDRRSRSAEGLRVYQAFEVDFQLDGHYWLQYGQYLVEIGMPEEALPILHKSIQAYENNSFAWHSLADVQLRVAKRRAAYDSQTIELIGDAVKILKGQDASPDLKTDSYAIVTLSLGHIGALVKHGRTTEARSHAASYFERVEELNRRFSDKALRIARERLFAFLATGEWKDVGSRGRNPSRR